MRKNNICFKSSTIPDAKLEGTCFSRLYEGQDIIIFTDVDIKKGLMAPYSEIEDKRVWLVEPRELIREIYILVLQTLPNWTKVYTADKDFLKLVNHLHPGKGIYSPYGDQWVTDTKKYDKIKDISMIASTKDFLPGHHMRHEVIRKYGHMFDRNVERIEKKEELLSGYAYSIAIENVSVPSYYTEKLLDCFATRTVPIYWGAPDISDHFDIRGIIEFNTVKGLGMVLPECNMKLYASMKEAIENNYKLAQKVNHCVFNIERCL